MASPGTSGTARSSPPSTACATSADRSASASRGSPSWERSPARSIPGGACQDRWPPSRRPCWVVPTWSAPTTSEKPSRRCAWPRPYVAPVRVAEHVAGHPGLPVVGCDRHPPGRAGPLPRLRHVQGDARRPDAARAGRPHGRLLPRPPVRALRHQLDPRQLLVFLGARPHRALPARAAPRAGAGRPESALRRGDAGGTREAEPPARRGGQGRRVPGRQAHRRAHGSGAGNGVAQLHRARRAARRPCLGRSARKPLPAVLAPARRRRLHPWRTRRRGGRLPSAVPQRPARTRDGHAAPRGPRAQRGDRRGRAGGLRGERPDLTGGRGPHGEPAGFRGVTGRTALVDPGPRMAQKVVGRRPVAPHDWPMTNAVSLLAVMINAVGGSGGGAISLLAAMINAVGGSGGGAISRVAVMINAVGGSGGGAAPLPPRTG